ncbi:MAG: hypothetical protein AB7H93_06055 [Vicinamibacterales bacterium]
MSTERHDRGKPLSLTVSTTERPKFSEPLTAFLFDAQGALAERADVKDGRVTLKTPSGGLGRHRLFIAPAVDETRPLTPASLTRLGAYEPVLHRHDGIVTDITIPGVVIDHWPFCVCWVRGRVVRAADNRAVCDARVHICEVDRIPWIIAELPDFEVVKLRDDLLDLLRRPPVPPRPWPDPWPPDPDPGPFPGPRPGPDPSPLFRFDRGAISGFDPQPDPPGTRVGLNPQPLPPRSRVRLNPQPEPPSAGSAGEAIVLAPDLQARLRSTSPVVVRATLIEHWKLLLPWLCWRPWFWRYRCDEVAVVTTDNQGRFETRVFYPCGGDRPDLYFWVEFDFGSGFETVYHPPIACHTWWDYACGTEVVLRVTDPRVPGCEHEPDLPGCQVVVLSIGPGVAVREVQTSGGGEGQTLAGQPFGHTLEPRVDFSRTELIVNKNVPYYRWSYRRLSAPDGGAGPVDASSVPLGGTPTVLTKDVYRHYKLGTSYPSELMGPMPSGPAPLPNLFRIRPQNPPAGTEWVVLDEHVDLATAYFDTHTLAGATGASPTTPDLAAGRYELILELFDAAGALVDWTAKGIDLRITDQDAPFGTGTITTSPAPAYNRVLVGGHTMGFRMVLRVDNNRCYAEILPVGGDVTPDPDCGFHNYSDPSDDAALSFVARHPHQFATYGFSTTRGPGGTIGAAGTGGTAGAAGTNGFVETSDFTYAKDVAVSALLGTCGNAAFGEGLDVHATATNGYTRLSGYDAHDIAAFALAVPCPECECDDEEDGDGPDR